MQSGGVNREWRRNFLDWNPGKGNVKTARVSFAYVKGYRTISRASVTATAGRNTTVQSQLICSLQVCLIPLINWSVGSPYARAYIRMAVIKRVALATYVYLHVRALFGITPRSTVCVYASRYFRQKKNLDREIRTFRFAILCRRNTTKFNNNIMIAI